MIERWSPEFRGENFAGEEVERFVLLSLGEKDGDGNTRFKENTGLVLAMEGEKILIEDVWFGSQAQRIGIGFGWELLWAQVEAERMAKQWFYMLQTLQPFPGGLKNILIASKVKPN